MAKRFKRKSIGLGNIRPPARTDTKNICRTDWLALVGKSWIPLLLAAITFVAYAPSLASDFVYDAREEILAEGFITSFSNLPDVLSLRVLGMNLMLGDRPGQLFYLMLIASVCGKEPLGYHVCSNLLHAANAALLFVLLIRLVDAERPDLPRNLNPHVQFATAIVTLLFALHPLNVETVSDVSYSSDLLATFFSLLVLLAAVAFSPNKAGAALAYGSAGTFCTFAAVTSKESGLAAVGLLISYWFLFRRREQKKPWFFFLAAATTLTAAFLAARFALAPASAYQASYLGGSFCQVFWIQPRLWVFMIGKLVWPVALSADYTLDDLSDLSTPISMAVLVALFLLQGWLLRKSRLGALGVAAYWMGLSMVSNFVPLNRVLGDRFYYLPLAGVAMQVTALLLMTLTSRWAFWSSIAACAASLFPLLLLTVEREDVFSNELSFWTATRQASPFSSRAHAGLGGLCLQTGKLDDAISEYREALKLDPNYALAQMNMGVALFEKGEPEEATSHLKKAVEIDPTAVSAHYDLALVLSRQGQMDEALAEFQKTLLLDPHYAQAHEGLGNILLQKGQTEGAIREFREALRLQPSLTDAQNDLARTLNLPRKSK